MNARRLVRSALRSIEGARVPVVALAMATCACAVPTGPGPSTPSGVAATSITVTSKSFPSGGAIPVDYTCDGKDLSPQLTWSSPPENTKSLVIVVDDPDASSGAFTHWIVFGLPPDATSLAEGVDPSTLGAKVGANDFHNVHYNGPCPPRREEHRYQFHVYATDAVLKVRDGATRDVLDAALSEHVLGAGHLVAVFAH